MTNALLPSSTQLLSEGLSKAKQLRQSGSRPNTARAYQSDLHYFWSWAEIAHQLTPGTLPLTSNIIECFVGDHLFGLHETVIIALQSRGFKPKQGRLKISTIKRRLSSIAKYHQAKGFSKSHIYTPQILQTLRAAAESAFSDSLTTSKKTAITPEIYQALIEATDDSLIGIRDRALLSVALWSGGRRRSELCQMQVAHLEEHTETEAPYVSYTLTLAQTKSHYAIDGVPSLPIKDIAAEHLQQWLTASKISEGAIFRTIDPRSNRIRSSISGEAIRQIIKKLSHSAGLDDLKLSPHSLRSGFVTMCAHAGIPMERGMSMSLHKTVSAYLSYSRAGDALLNPAADLSRQVLRVKKP